MKKEIIEIDLKTGKAIDNVKKLDTSVKKVTKSTKDVDVANKELGSGLDKMTGGAVSKFKGMLSSIKAVTGGFNIMKVAIIGTGIGALLIAIVALKAAFSNSEEGQNKFAKIMGVIGSVTGNFVDLLASLGDKIIWVFENPKKAIKDFVKLLKENIINRFNGLLELVPALGKAVSQLFKGDFAGAAETAANAVAKVALGTENLTGSIKAAADALKKLGEEVAADAKEAAKIADKRAVADKIERGLIVERAKADRDIAELRFKSEQREKFNATERIAFLKDASKISEDIANKEIAANRLRLNAQIAENKLSGSTKDDLNKVAELKAKGIQLDTAKLNLQKRLQTSLTTFQNEEIAGAKKITDAAQKVIDDAKVISDKKIVDDAKTEKERLDAIDKIQEDYKIKKENDDAETEIQKIELEQTRSLAELDRLNATKEQKALTIAYWNNKITEQNKKDGEKQIADETKIAEAKIALQLQLAGAIGNALGSISQLFERGTAASKAAALAEIVIGTGIGFIQGLDIAQKGAKATGPAAPFAFPIFYATQIAAVLGAAGKAKNILTQVKGGGGGGANIGGAPSIPKQKAQAPSFNVVGSGGTNQLASAIGDQSQKPVKTYVVAKEVTTQAEMDRNIVKSASFG